MAKVRITVHDTGENFGCYAVVRYASNGHRVWDTLEEFDVFAQAARSSVMRYAVDWAEAQGHTVIVDNDNDE